MPRFYPPFPEPAALLDEATTEVTRNCWFCGRFGSWVVNSPGYYRCWFCDVAWGPPAVGTVWAPDEKYCNWVITSSFDTEGDPISVKVFYHDHGASSWPSPG